MKMEREPGVRQGAFFDLERTITADAVEQVASLAMWRRGDVSTSQVLRVLWCYLRYNLGLIADFEQLKAQGACVFEDREPGRDARLLEELYGDRLQSAIFPEARRLIEEAQAAGMHLAIVSSTYRFMVEPYARDLGIEDLYGCELEVVDGRCTGALQGPIYHQEAKATCVRALATQHDLSLEHSYAFGDSMNDLPMLEAVGRPVVVNPGAKLGAHARGSGWTRVSWPRPPAPRS
jgi:HAD superfamily hydrolase (TIGR01490 family)